MRISPCFYVDFQVLLRKQYFLIALWEAMVPNIGFREKTMTKILAELYLGGDMYTYLRNSWLKREKLYLM